MFTKPIDEITFEDVKSFCDVWAEGVRVEYKKEIRHIPKIVSSFANTHGGIFLIGVEADQTNNMPICPIEGIPKDSGIEERIQQSALTGIYPGINPGIKLVDVPNSNNVVVIVRVDESLQAPHAIKDVTQVYIRVGSITQPYEYKHANMGNIAYMFKRREDSQVVARQILTRFEERATHKFPLSEPTLTVIAKPVFPYRPVISVLDIYKLHSAQELPPRKVAGGVSYLNPGRCHELNEYGIVYHRTTLARSDEGGIDYGEFIRHIKYLIDQANDIYKECKYLGNIEVTAQLQQVYNKKLTDTINHPSGRKITENIPEGPVCSDSEVCASNQCLSSDFEDTEKRKDIVEELIHELLWPFNIPIGELWIRERIRQRIGWN